MNKIKEIKVIVCPNCGETWELTTEAPKMCKCFRCGFEYCQHKPYIMDDFVFNAIRTVKGN